MRCSYPVFGRIGSRPEKMNNGSCLILLARRLLTRFGVPRDRWPSAVVSLALPTLVADAAAIPAGAFYQHFRSKEQLLLFLMEKLLQDLNRLKFDVRIDDIRGSLQDALSTAFAAELPYAPAYRAWRRAHAIAERSSRRRRPDDSAPVRPILLGAARAHYARSG